MEKKCPNWECMFVLRKQGIFLSVSVDVIRMVGKTQNMAHMCKKLLKNVDIDEPTSFLDHIKCWDVPSVNAKRMKQFLNDIRNV